MTRRANISAEAADNVWKVREWLLCHPLQREGDLALLTTPQMSRSTIHRLLERLIADGQVERCSPAGRSASRTARPLYFLTHVGLLAIARDLHTDPVQLAEQWGANEAGVLNLLGRLGGLLMLQNLINSLVAHAPERLAEQGHRASLTWYWRRDWSHAFLSRGRKKRCAVDATLLFAQEGAAPGGQDAFYPVFLLVDAGLHAPNDRLMLEQRLEQILNYRESNERLFCYQAFPPLLVLAPTLRQCEHWQRAVDALAARRRVTPLCGAIVALSPQQVIGSGWSLPWLDLSTRAVRRIEDLLVSVPPEAIPPGFLPVQPPPLVVPPKPPRLVLGHYRQRATLQASRTPDPTNPTAVQLFSTRLSQAQRDLLLPFYAHPLLSIEEFARFTGMKYATAARAFSDLGRLGTITRVDTRCGHRWQLSALGLRVMAAILHVPVQHVAETTPDGTLMQRGLAPLARLINHTAGVYHFMAELHRAAAEQGHRILWWEHGPWCERWYRDHQIGHNLRPDAMLAYQTDTQRMRAWLEWDEGTLTPRELAAKMHAYADYVRSREWMRERQPLPLLLMVVPDPEQERRARYSAMLAQEAGLRVWTTTATRLASSGPLGAIWAPPLTREQVEASVTSERQAWVYLTHAA